MPVDGSGPDIVVPLLVKKHHQAVKVTKDRDSPLHDPAPTMGFVMGCPEYQIRMEER